MNRNLSRFSRRANSRALRVPIRLTRTSLDGSSRDSWMLGVRAAAWTIPSTGPVTSVDQAAGSATSSTAYSTRSLGVPERGAKSSGGMTSAAVTCAPPRAKALTNALPKNPPAPVTSTLISPCSSLLLRGAQSLHDLPGRIAPRGRGAGRALSNISRPAARTLPPSTGGRTHLTTDPPDCSSGYRSVRRDAPEGRAPCR